ncbi:diguanylate cyclase domain-containing protein, partial [Permianibacter aggregans]
MEAYQREMEKRFEQIELQSSTDGLTGLKNRWAFDLRLEEEFSRTTRNAAPLALALLDVDSF